MCPTKIVALKASIRALAYRQPILLASSGSKICLWYEGDTIKLLNSLEIDLRQTIIGIKFEDDVLVKSRKTEIENWKIQNVFAENVVVYSTQFFLFCRLRVTFDERHEVINYELVQHYKANLIYWIIDIIFGDNRAYILNSRNEVIVYDLLQRRITNRIFGPQKCILYSGKFIQYNHNYLVISSGTVFKTILLWIVEIDPTTRDCRSFNLQALHGHDGVIFSIDYNAKYNVLVSASDDRSIRIWTRNESFEQDGHEHEHSLDIAFWKKNFFVTNHVYYGHGARIWQITTFDIHKTPIIISTGEDSSIFAWTLLPPRTMVQRKSLLRNNRIWCFQKLRDCIAFGGSDSSIKFVDINDFLGINEFETFFFSFPVIMPKALTFLRCDSQSSKLLLSSIRGNFHLFNDCTMQKLQLNSSVCSEPMAEIFDDYICLAHNLSKTKSVIASKFGHIGLLTQVEQDLRLTFLQKFFESKIFNLSFVDDQHFICCLGNGQINLFAVTDLELRDIGKSHFILPVTRHPWSSCGLLIESVLIVGDYSGSVFAFYLDSPNPVSQFRHIHGPNGVTNLSQKPYSNLVYTSGKNGKIFEFLLESKHPTENVFDTLKLLRTFIVFPEMEWIAGFCFDQVAPFAMKYVYGFESCHFRLWNLFENRVVFEEECGGGHRSWDLLIEEEASTMMSFGYTKKNQLKVMRRRLPHSCAYPNETYCSLPRKINCCSLLYECRRFVYFVIGGEDTQIQVVRYGKFDQSLWACITLYGHISNIASIKCLPPRAIQPHGPISIHMVSVGGRSQLIVWKFVVIDKEPDEQQLICVEKMSNFLSFNEQNLSFEERVRKVNKQMMHYVDIRYLDVDLCYVDNCDNEVLILVACSDSSFRLYRYCDTEARIVASQKACTGTACVLVCKFLASEARKSPKFDINLAAMGSADGHLSVWQFNTENLNDSRLIMVKQLHQAGINSINFTFIKDDIFLLLTGGDDNVLKLTTISINEDTIEKQRNLSIIASFEDNSIHSCQITGLRFLSPTRFVSVSIDQKVVCWQILSSLVAEEKQSISQISANIVNSQISTVADISSVEIFSCKSDNFALVCGEGFELLQLA